MVTTWVQIPASAFLTVVVSDSLPSAVRSLGLEAYLNADGNR